MAVTEFLVAPWDFATFRSTMDSIRDRGPHANFMPMSSEVAAKPSKWLSRSKLGTLCPGARFSFLMNRISL